MDGQLEHSSSTAGGKACPTSTGQFSAYSGAARWKELLAIRAQAEEGGSLRAVHHGLSVPHRRRRRVKRTGATEVDPYAGTSIWLTCSST